MTAVSSLIDLIHRIQRRLGTAIDYVSFIVNVAGCIIVYHRGTIAQTIASGSRNIQDIFRLVRSAHAAVTPDDVHILYVGGEGVRIPAINFVNGISGPITQNLCAVACPCVQEHTIAALPAFNDRRGEQSNGDRLANDGRITRLCCMRTALYCSGGPMSAAKMRLRFYQALAYRFLCAQISGLNAAAVVPNVVNGRNALKRLVSPTGRVNINQRAWPCAQQSTFVIVLPGIQVHRTPCRRLLGTNNDRIESHLVVLRNLSCINLNG